LEQAAAPTQSRATRAIRTVLFMVTFLQTGLISDSQ
jgi:hypothetical protein